ncbi:hypothetical protein POMI540_3214 [Schizosaccharomyces pombe]|uniref:Altered inheritance of mitochondria protein 19 homolog n=1 Tax=Schizosaccharomyces pombe (strain 972 / ATCC 24843) TaxID=284812 RepID=AIM19_SCHPO|nr:uncharacterized protein SPBC17A3.02 [Schizosaccharomyces pombe]Q9UUF4.1 RecName: Full=Altered inheritance of mitochondria protein 19 homolog [Schizosaccharomyces pombe 972h-]CAB51761.1 conserved fungal protein [Schizosaccharomyces pombe]|eukprot:NP_595584.1 uncharacterized protein SPBC17A3.02 [Schizosaccharomyces pombe]
MENKELRKSYFQRIYQSYIPAYAFGGALIASVPRAFKRPYGGPFVPGCLLCGGFNAIGGLAIASGDLTNGSGICTAWSIAYLMINATKSIKSFRLYPIALTTFATANAVGYGKTFMNEY